jgi:mannose-6-phosphate isomerase
MEFLAPLVFLIEFWQGNRTLGGVNEPIFFQPLCMERVWGGRRLEELPGKVLPPSVPIGELWEVVDREEAQSIVSEGNWKGASLHELWKNHRAAIFGEAYISSSAPRFPLLVKLLDASEKLSVQVHPPLNKAAELGGEPKTEVWYFLDSLPEASIYAGLKKGVTRDEFEVLLENGGVESALHQAPVKSGESIFIPSGRLHAIGEGNVIIEVQQNSDTTYRVFDWNRVGLDGKPRELHVEQSLKCIDFSDVDPVLDRGKSLLAECEHFRVSRVQTGHAVCEGRFRLIMPITEVQWAGETLAPGGLALLPVSAVKAEPEGEWLEIEMPA